MFTLNSLFNSKVYVFLSFGKILDLGYVCMYVGQDILLALLGPTCIKIYLTGTVFTNHQEKGQ